MSTVITFPIFLLGSVTQPRAINDSGQVITSSPDAYGDCTVTLATGGETSVWPISGDTQAHAYGINNSGVVVGSSETSTGTRAVRWQNGTATDLGSLAGAGGGARAFAINSAGQIAGSSRTASGADDACLWQNGKVIDLGTLSGGGSYVPGTVNSRALAINDQGQVVGYSLTSNNNDHAFLWQGGAITDLGTLTGGTKSFAESINNSGTAVGYATDSNGLDQAVTWQSGTIAELGGLVSGGSSAAWAVNNNGIVVGEAAATTSIYASFHAVIWQNGRIIDLNSLLPANSGWVLTDATAINNQGQIVGIATYSGKPTTFLVTLGDSGTLGISAQSAVAAFQTNPYGPAAIVTDNAANVMANVDSLETLAGAGKLLAINLTGSGTPSLTLTYNQYSSDWLVRDAIAGNYSLTISGAGARNAWSALYYDAHVHSLSISDASDVIATYLDDLEPYAATGRISTISATNSSPGYYLSYQQYTSDHDVIKLFSGSYSLSVSDATAAQALALGPTAHVSQVLVKDTVANVLTNASNLQATTATGGPNYLFRVADTAANVFGNLDSLNSLYTSGKIDYITITDTGFPTLSITAQQFSNDRGVLTKLFGNFSLSIDASAPNLTVDGLSSHAITVVFGGSASQYGVSASNGQITVTDTGTGRSSVDHWTNVTALQFSDITEIVAHQPGTGSTVTTGNITELYGAVFGRLPDAAGLNYYAQLAQNYPTLPLTTYAEFFLQSPEYTRNTAHNYAQNSTGDAQFITDIYNNLLHRAPETGAIPYYQNLIGAITAGTVAGTTAGTAAELLAHAIVLVDVSSSAEFLGDVQITSVHPADSQHWLLLI